MLFYHISIPIQSIKRINFNPDKLQIGSLFHVHLRYYLSAQVLNIAAKRLGIWFTRTEYQRW